MFPRCATGSEKATKKYSFQIFDKIYREMLTRAPRTGRERPANVQRAILEDDGLRDF